MTQQSLKNKRSEIRFRRDLISQQVEDAAIFDDEYDAKGIEEILTARMEETARKMRLLKEEGVRLSPYIEIGAERCQSSLVMENDFGATGAAVDISYDMLKSCSYYAGVFGKTKIPLRACCDVYNLPFRSNSIPFAFCYETLHHFPDLTPVIKEIHRVLSPGGYFFFDKEPYRQILHLSLYKRKKAAFRGQQAKATQLSGASKLRKISSPILFLKIRKMCDDFFSTAELNEIKYGIIENHGLSVGAWKRALGLFDEKRVELQSRAGVNTGLFGPRHSARFLKAWLFGGNITGLCRKIGSAVKDDVSLQDTTICPCCQKDKRESGLTQNGRFFSCKVCSSDFPVVDGVIFLLTPEERKKLYPEIFE
ncbi:MAG: class I SAM-dependent methyltransferase [Candidatus Omnitrophica bacterium]|nr:class I SAM-dependent methyltransferase [Candidatus Omnitrophota bacterium]